MTRVRKGKQGGKNPAAPGPYSINNTQKRKEYAAGKGGRKTDLKEEVSPAGTGPQTISRRQLSGQTNQEEAPSRKK